MEDYSSEAAVAVEEEYSEVVLAVAYSSEVVEGEDHSEEVVVE